MSKLLIVVDYQNDFVSGALGFERAAVLEDAIAAKILAYRENNDEIIFTYDTHDENYLQTQEGTFLPIAHCFQGSDGWELYGKIDALKLPQDRCFYKPAFGSAELFDYLRGQTYQSIELVGVVSNICVISNAILAKTALPEVPVLVDAGCIAGNDDALHQAALAVMQGLQIKVFNQNISSKE